jgi:hypothetical protein
MKSWIAIAMLIVPIFLPRVGLANDIKQDLTSGPYRIELELLPPEPFYSAKRVAAAEAKSGMLVLGGAQPVQPEALSHPNHHLVVHVFQNIDWEGAHECESAPFISAFR